MVASAVAFAVLSWWVDWDKSVFQIEFCLITLFMAFWVVQTRRGWHPELGAAYLPRVVRGLAEKA